MSVGLITADRRSRELVHGHSPGIVGWRVVLSFPQVARHTVGLLPVGVSVATDSQQKDS